jgi:hypothetical protein
MRPFDSQWTFIYVHFLMDMLGKYMLVFMFLHLSQILKGSLHRHRSVLLSVPIRGRIMLFGHPLLLIRRTNHLNVYKLSGKLLDFYAP